MYQFCERLGRQCLMLTEVRFKILLPRIIRGYCFHEVTWKLKIKSVFYTFTVGAKICHWKEPIFFETRSDGITLSPLKVFDCSRPQFFGGIFGILFMFLYITLYTYIYFITYCIIFRIYSYNIVTWPKNLCRSVLFSFHQCYGNQCINVPFTLFVRS